MENVQQGKKVVIGIIIALLAIDIIVSWLTVSMYQSLGDVVQMKQALTQGGIRLVLTCLLCYFLYKKRSWARWILIALTAIGGVGMIFQALGFSFLLVMAAIYLICAGLLLFNRSVKAFLTSKENTAIQ